MTKAVIFDTSTIISFAMNSLLNDLRNLKKSFDGKFLITKEVLYEVIERPLGIKRFALEALQVKELIDEKVLEMPEAVGVKSAEIAAKTKEIMDSANNAFIGERSEIKLISSGEASGMALSLILSAKKIENVLAVDERTTRMICESPESHSRYLQKKMHTRITVKKENLKIFQGIKIIRSVELIYVAYKKGLVKYGDGKLLDAILWAMKFKGCSVSPEEINEIKRLKS